LAPAPARAVAVAGSRRVDPFRPVPGGDIGEAWGQALDHLYQVACQCTEVPPDQCMAMHAEERACEIANVQANAEIAGAYLECACDPNLILDCVAVAADGQDHITARCGEPPAGIIEGQECSTSDDVSFPCFGGGEVPAHAVCDGFADCSDGSDEMVCEEPTDEYYECGDGTQIYADWVCDGEADCSNGSDEADCEPVEPGPEFICADGGMIPFSWVCDGEADCGDASDEAQCSEI
jgi:hypothetical protein